MITAHSPPPITKTVQGLYDFAADGGVVGAIGLGAHIPINAIIIRSWYKVLTAPASDGAAKIAMGIADDDVDAILGATLHDDGVFAEDEFDGIQAGLATNFSMKTTANRELTLTIIDFDLTAGKIALYADYVTSA